MTLALPPIGLGCSPVRGEEAVDLREPITTALRSGYRLFDTAEAYGTESLLGELLGAESPRHATVISKLWQTNHRFTEAIAACEASLRRLRRESVEVYLIHSPAAWRHVGPLGTEPLPPSTAELVARATPRARDGRIELDDVPLEETWSALVELRRRGLVRHIGIANAGRAELELLRRSGAPVEVLQIELHPLRPRAKLREYCARHGIAVVAHTPLGGGRLLSDERLRALSRDAACSPAALVLRWHRERGVVPVPGTLDPRHLRENLEAATAPPLGEGVERELTALSAEAPDAEEGE